MGYGIPPAGHRLPAATRLGPVRLQVADLDRSLEYYGRVLGLRAVNRDHRRVTLAAHGEDRPLIHLEERDGAAPVPRHGHIGLYHFALLLPTRSPAGDDDAKLLEWTVELSDAEEVLAVAESLEAAGYLVERPSAGEIRTRDPRGTQLRVRVAVASDGRV